MKKLTSLIINVLLMSLVSLSAMASDSHKAGIRFGGAAFGYYNESVKGAAMLSSSNQNWGWNVFAGLRLNDMFGVRVGYYELSDTEHARDDNHYLGSDHYFLKAYDAVLLVNVPLGYATDVSLRAGGAAVNQDVFNLIKSSDPVPEVNIKITQILPEVGLALHFHHNRLFATEWTWTHIHGSDAIHNIDMLSFGVALTIPM